MTSEELRRLLREEFQPIKNDISVIKQDLTGLKEQGKITREGVNTLLEWAE